ncbi:MAG: hypothetical protein NZ920_03170 [Aigarchaeota archaeon]|nr:hypothetical protein [Aigarchaeota archaeon]MDW8092378.1 hypothetical protein [Nitrososphaerota archaeon]
MYGESISKDIMLLHSRSLTTTLTGSVTSTVTTERTVTVVTERTVTVTTKQYAPGYPY